MYGYLFIYSYSFECIKAWTDKSSYCPLCKGQVKSIEARTPKDGRRKRNPALHKIRKRHYKVNFNDTGKYRLTYD